MSEQTFILIKPDHVNLAEEILKELDKYGYRIKTYRVDNVPIEIIQDHYFPHRDKSFFEYMTSSFVGKSVIIAVYEGEGIIQKLIDVIGPTDPAKALRDTIRGRYSNDSLEKAVSESRPVRNVIHRSDSLGEAIREINVWNNYFNN